MYNQIEGDFFYFICKADLIKIHEMKNKIFQ